jgi:hypothetical protein
MYFAFDAVGLTWPQQQQYNQHIEICIPREIVIVRLVGKLIGTGLLLKVRLRQDRMRRVRVGDWGCREWILAMMHQVVAVGLLRPLRISYVLSKGSYV